MHAYGPRPEREHEPRAPELAQAIGEMCMRTGYAQDGRAFACARLRHHDGRCAGRDNTGHVWLGYRHP